MKLFYHFKESIHSLPEHRISQPLILLLLAVIFAQFVISLPILVGKEGLLKKTLNVGNLTQLDYIKILLYALFDIILIYACTFIIVAALAYLVHKITAYFKYTVSTLKLINIYLYAQLWGLIMWVPVIVLVDLIPHNWVRISNVTVKFLADSINILAKIVFLIVLVYGLIISLKRSDASQHA